MADQRMTTATVITDPSTSTRQATVDASNRLLTTVDTVIPGTGASNLGKPEDGPHTTGDVGVMALAVRDDTLDIRSGAENDYEPLHTNASGALWVAGNGTFIVTDDGAFDIATITTSVVPGTGATHLGKAEDAVHASGDVGVMALALRSNTAAAKTDLDGDYHPLLVDTNGRLHVTDPNAGAGTPASPTLNTASTTALAAGSAANLDSADIGGLTRKLTQIDVSGSVPFKALIRTVVNAVNTDLWATLYSDSGGGTITWKPPHRDYTSKVFSANAGFDGFRLDVTNLDSTDAADFVATIYYEA